MTFELERPASRVRKTRRCSKNCTNDITVFDISAQIFRTVSVYFTTIRNLRRSRYFLHLCCGLLYMLNVL